MEYYSPLKSLQENNSQYTIEHSNEATMNPSPISFDTPASPILREVQQRRPSASFFSLVANSSSAVNTQQIFVQLDDQELQERIRQRQRKSGHRNCLHVEAPNKRLTDIKLRQDDSIVVVSIVSRAEEDYHVDSFLLLLDFSSADRPFSNCS